MIFVHGRVNVTLWAKKFQCSAIKEKMIIRDDFRFAKHDLLNISWAHFPFYGVVNLRFFHTSFNLSSLQKYLITISWNKFTKLCTWIILYTIVWNWDSPGMPAELLKLFEAEANGPASPPEDVAELLTGWPFFPTKFIKTFKHEIILYLIRTNHFLLHVLQLHPYPSRF